jgi:hypothetical protein
MNNLLIGLIVQLLIYFMMLGVVYSLPGKLLNKLNWCHLIWIERLAIGAVYVIIIFFIGGAFIALMPHQFRTNISFIFILILLITSLIGLKRGGLHDMRASTSQQRIVAISTLVLSMLALAMAWLPVRLPTELIDGPYVIKQDLPAVRVQHISGTLPIDNAIPHVVSEYLLRDIKFSDERPLMPGQEVSNRPIMVSFLMLPWHAVIAMPPQQKEPLSRFSYVGQSWPDFSKLLNDPSSWAVSVAIGTQLNALLLLMAGAWLVRQEKNDTKVTWLFSLLALSSPYVFVQTFYTWPKSLAGFFIILAYVAILRGLPIAVSAVALGLAYWSHPYSIVYFICFAIWLISCFDKSDVSYVKFTERKFFKFILIFILVVMPWFVWTRLMVRIPSDLVTQNLIQHGQSWYDFIWVRVVNIYATFAPTYFQIYPFDASAIFRSMSVNFAGAVGVIPLFLLIQKFSIDENLNDNVIYPLILPGILLVAVFSNLAVPALHGLQPLVVLGIASAVSYVPHSKISKLLFLFLIIQVVLNLMLFGRYINKIF